MEVAGVPVTIEVIGVATTIVGTFVTISITVSAIILAWKSDRRTQENIALRLGTMLENIAAGQKEITQMIATGQKEIVAGQKEIAQMLLNQTKILEKMEARMAGI